MNPPPPRSKLGGGVVGGIDRSGSGQWLMKGDYTKLGEVEL